MVNQLKSALHHYRLTVEGYISEKYATALADACEMRGPLSYEFDPRNGGMTIIVLADLGEEPEFDPEATLIAWDVDPKTIKMDVS